MTTTTETSERDYLTAEVVRARRYLAEHSNLPPVAQDAYNDFIRLTEGEVMKTTQTERRDLWYGEAADFYSLVSATLAHDLGIGPDTTDDEINALAATEFQMAREQGQIVSGIFSYLRDLRDGLRSDGCDDVDDEERAYERAGLTVIGYDARDGYIILCSGCHTEPCVCDSRIDASEY